MRRSGWGLANWTGCFAALYVVQHITGPEIIDVITQQKKQGNTSWQIGFS